MKQEDEGGIIGPSPANDNESPRETLDPRIRIIARAIGRQIAREQRAANDNQPRGERPEEEGQWPDG